MLLLIQKTLAMLIMPLGMVWLILFGMVIWSWRLRKPGFAALLSLLWIIFTAAGNPWVGQRLMARLEQKVQVEDPATGPILDAIFVLGGGSDLNALGQPQLGLSGDRIAEAARLWHAGRTMVLVASGRSNDGRHGDRDLGQETRTLWLGLGIPDTAIRVVETPCYITREEIAAYRVLCNQQKWTRVGLLTSAWHLPRAMRLAQKASLVATPFASDYQGRLRHFRPQDLVPQSEGIRPTQLAIWEMVGQAIGR